MGDAAVGIFNGQPGAANAGNLFGPVADEDHLRDIAQIGPQ